MRVIVEGIQFNRQVSHKGGRICGSEECGKEIKVGDEYYRVAKADAEMLNKEGEVMRGSRRKISGLRAERQGYVDNAEKIEVFHEQCFEREFCA